MRSFVLVRRCYRRSFCRFIPLILPLREHRTSRVYLFLERIKGNAQRLLRYVIIGPRELQLVQQ